jgi:hypothetical protein
MPNLNGHIEGRISVGRDWEIRGEPVEPLDLHLSYEEIFFTSDHDGSSLRLDLNHKQGFRKSASEPSPLPHCKAGIPLMLSHRLTGHSHDRSRLQGGVPRGQALGEESAVIAGGNEADFLGLRFLGCDEAPRSGHLSDFRLGEVSQRESELGQDVLRDPPEEVGLIFVFIGPSEEGGWHCPFARKHSDVMPSCNPIAPEGLSPGHQIPQLRIGVTAHAGIRCPTPRVFCNKIINHIPGELLFHIENVVGDP